MNTRVLAGIAFLAVVASPAPASAAGLPEIKVSERNPVPACVTPSRLTEFLKARNPKLEPRFEEIAGLYRRHGSALKLRWDVAFFQMVVETNYLTFKRGDGRNGDVRITQNNFAGLGATGRGASGESFPDVSTGVLAHLQHILMYTGADVPDAVAERTRNVQKWGVLTSWQKTIKGPMTYSQLAQRWAAGGGDYAAGIATHARLFHDKYCKGDAAAVAPAEEDEDEATPAAAPPPRQEEAKAPPAAPAPAADPTPRIAGIKVDEKSAEERAEELKKGPETPTRLGLGATSLIRAPLDLGKQPDEAATPPQAEPVAPARPIEPAAAPAVPRVEPPAAAPPKAAGVCRVFTASYGGSRAVIIKSRVGDVTNYTVLDVNEGAESREVEAYVQAYAKGGEEVARFPDPAKALDRAFELCPEG